jgi:hypothetical protein
MWNRLSGWKTTLAGLLFFIASFADVLGMIDLRTTLPLLGVPVEKVGAVVAIVTVVFMLLRAFTNGPMFGKKDDD